MTPDAWVLLPLGVTVATVAMSLGIAGANLWIPIFALVWQLDPRLAFWMALLTMACGTLSGVVRNAVAKTIAWDTVAALLPLVVVGAVLGALASRLTDPTLAMGAFAVFAAGNGLLMLVRRPSKKPFEGLRWLALLAGVLHGVLATGCGVLLMRPVTQRAPVEKQPAAIGAAVLLVFAASTVAALARLDADMRSTLIAQRAELLELAMWVVPGVILGGQLGPRLARRVAGPALRPYAGIVLLLVALVLGARAFA